MERMHYSAHKPTDSQLSTLRKIKLKFTLNTGLYNHFSMLISIITSLGTLSSKLARINR